MTTDKMLFIAIACYAIAVVLFRPLIVSLLRYAVSVVTGLPSALRSKALLIGFMVAALGLSLAVWASRSGDPLQGLPGDASQSPTVKSVPEKGATRGKHHA